MSNERILKLKEIGFFDSDRMRRAFIRNIGRPPHDIRKNFEPIN
jgi:transcriptional regulator GlxA family with amidase domain